MQTVSTYFPSCFMGLGEIGQLVEDFIEQFRRDQMGFATSMILWLP
jgi:hypothetical protein